MKPYKIFISFSTAQPELATKVKSILEELFDNKISFFFSDHDILGGDKWRNSIQIALKECDAILSVLTPKFLESPWFHIEWAPFWINDRKRFILLTDDIKTTNLTEIVKDTQITNIFNEHEVVKLYQSISKDLNINPEKEQSKSCASKLVNSATAIYNKILDNENRAKYGVYKDDLSLLPDDDFEKKEILKYFNKIGEDDIVLEIFLKIKDNAISNNILHSLLSKEEFGLIDKLVEHIIDRDVQLSLLKGLVDKNLENTESAEKLLDNISSDSPKLRSFAEYLLKKDKMSNPVFYDTVSKIGNFAELRKLAGIMAENNLYETKAFNDIILKFFSPTGNATELRKLLEYLFKYTNYPKTELEKHISNLSNKNQSATGSLLEALVEVDKSFVQKLLDLDIIRNSEVKQRVTNRMVG